MQFRDADFDIVDQCGGLPPGVQSLILQVRNEARCRQPADRLKLAGMRLSGIKFTLGVADIQRLCDALAQAIGWADKGVQCFANCFSKRLS